MDREKIRRLPEDTVGRRMRKLRLAAGLSQEKLSEYLGFTPNYYGQVERGMKDLSKNLANAMCEYFDVTYGYLYQGISPDQICEESSYDTCKNHIVSLLKNCTEIECETLYSITKLLVQGRRTGLSLYEIQMKMKKRPGRPRKNWRNMKRI